MKIIENIIPEYVQKDILKLHLGSIPFWFGPYSDIDENVKKFINFKYYDRPTPQLTHSYVENNTINSSFFDKVCYPILLSFTHKFKIENFYINRIKSNFLHQVGYHNIGIPHYDSEKKDIFSLLYYVHDSDGDTFFYKDADITVKKNLTPEEIINSKVTRIKPEMGKSVFFKSSNYHSSSNPVISRYRFVINFVLTIPNYEI